MDASFLGGGEKGHCRNEKLQSGWRNWSQNRHAQFTSTTTSLMADECERCWSQFSGQKKKTKWPQNTIDKTNKNSFAACNWGTRGGKKQYSKRKKNRRFKKFAPPIGSDVRKNLTATPVHVCTWVHSKHPTRKNFYWEPISGTEACTCSNKKGLKGKKKFRGG